MNIFQICQHFRKLNFSQFVNTFYNFPNNFFENIIIYYDFENIVLN